MTIQIVTIIQAIDNMLLLVTAGNSSLGSVVKVTMYLRNMKDYDQVDSVYQSCTSFSSPYFEINLL